MSAPAATPHKPEKYAPMEEDQQEQHHPPTTPKSHANPPQEASHPDRKTFPAVPVAGTDVEAVLKAGHHAVPISTKGAAVLQSMEARGKKGKGTEALGSKNQNNRTFLAPKMQSAAATTGVFETQSPEEYGKVKISEEVAQEAGLYETRGERRQRQAAETPSDLVEVWPRKEDVSQLESMIETAGVIQGVKLQKRGEVAKLQSAADRGASCHVSRKVADLLAEAAEIRPKDMKTRAEAKITRMKRGSTASAGAAAKTSAGRGGAAGGPQLVRGADHMTVDVTASVPTSNQEQRQQEQQQQQWQPAGQE